MYVIPKEKQRAVRRLHAAWLGETERRLWNRPPVHLAAGIIGEAARVEQGPP